MWTIAIFALTYGALFWFLALLTDSLWLQLLLFVIYIGVVESLHSSGALFRASARTSRFAQIVKTLFPVHFDEASVQTLHNLSRSNRQLMFCLAPHGPMCLHAAVGILGHGGEMPPVLSKQLRLVAHWSLRLIPFVRELASVFGVIDSTRITVEHALQQKQHLALIPCGMQSKIRVLTETPASAGTVVVHRHKSQFGFLSLAARYKVVIVPVLAPDENHIYTLYGTWLSCWPLTLIVGRFGVLPWQRSYMRVGAPIYTDEFAHWKSADMRALANRYYAELAKLAGSSHNLEVRELD